MTKPGMTPSIKLQFLIPVIYFLLALALFANVLVRHNPSQMQVVGMAVAIPAFVLWIIARFQLGNSFTIRPQASPLVTDGFYAKIRHPVYLFTHVTQMMQYEAKRVP
jgi:protein-S-isoprenylcysteine O-methyltransferase Ste14